MFPTHVGMNRLALAINGSMTHVPHTRGDEPPRREFQLRAGSMFPTHVGMNRERPLAFRLF